MTERSNNGTLWILLFAALLGAMVLLHTTPTGRSMIRGVHGRVSRDTATRDSS